MKSWRRLPTSAPLHVGCVLAASGAAAAQPAPPCAPSHRAAFDEDTSPSWFEASAALDRELAFADRPWSCAAATVVVRVSPRGPSVVEVLMPDGLSLRRHIGQPSELLPTVEAMLVVGRAVPAPVAAPPAAPVDEHERPPPVMVATPVVLVAPPRRGSVVFHADAEALASVGGSPLYLTPGLRLGGGMRLGHVQVTAHLQYEALSVETTEAYEHASVDTWSVGLGVAWALALGRGLLSVGPTVAVASVAVTERRTDDEIAQARVGLGVQWRSRAEGFALLLGAHGGVSVAELFGTARDYNPGLPAPPTWSAGLSAGVTFGARP